MKSLLIVALFGLSFLGAVPATAQSSRAVNSAKIEILERQVTMLRTRLGTNPAAPQTDSTPATANPQLMADLSAKIGTLETQIRRLTGRLEEFEHGQRQMQAQIDTLQKEMALQRAEDRRAATTGQGVLGEVGSGQAIGQEAVKPSLEDTPVGADGGEALAPAAEAPAAILVELPAGEPAVQFDYAFAFVRKNDLARGQLAFEEFLKANPGDSRVGNAKYWLGRIHLQEGSNAKAAQYLLSLIEDHPNHAKRPDALVDLADVLLKLDSADDACNALTEFRRIEGKASARLKARASRVAAAARCG
jgi:TolA-binding protein